jgi:hypothetical protein
VGPEDGSSGPTLSYFSSRPKFLRSEPLQSEAT